MKEFIEKLTEKLYENVKGKSCPDEACWAHLNKDCDNCDSKEIKVEDVIRIANELAEEYMIDVPTIDAGELLGNGWISCSERLPNKQGWYHITIEENGKYRVEHDLYAIETADSFGHEHGFCKRKKHNIVAWHEYPAPYQPKGDNNG